MLREIVFKFNEKYIYHDIIESLVTALEAKDYYTSGHSKRVAFMTYELAKRLEIRGRKLNEIHVAAHVHDIGKIGVPDVILNKKRRLLPHEWEYVKMHSIIGYNILSKSSKLNTISKIVLHHHESWDGNGYPDGLYGTNIPLGSRIIAVCDSIDAMMSDRPYRKAMKFNDCMKEIISSKCIMFDPVIVSFVEGNLEFINKLVISRMNETSRE